MSNQLKLVVGIPAYGGMITAHQARQWMEFGATLSGSVERFNLAAFTFVDANPIDKARNVLLKEARECGADWLLMLDADTWVESDNLDDDDAGSLLLRMISEADRLSAAIVAAPVIQRGGDCEIEMIYRLPNSGWAAREGLISVFDDDPELVHAGRLIPIDAAATACMAISIPRTMGLSFRFNYELGLSEDLDFCRQVQERCAQQLSAIFCDPRVRTGHTSRTRALYSR